MSTRKLSYSEKMSTGLTGGTAKSRARAAANRQIEELGQNDQMIALMRQQVELLQYLADWAHRQEQRALASGL